MQSIRTFSLILLFLWVAVAVVLNLFGIKLFFPFSAEISGQKEIACRQTLSSGYFSRIDGTIAT